MSPFWSTEFTGGSQTYLENLCIPDHYMVSTCHIYDIMMFIYKQTLLGTGSQYQVFEKRRCDADVS